MNETNTVETVGTPSDAVLIAQVKYESIKDTTMFVSALIFIAFFARGMVKYLDSGVIK